MKVDLMIGVVGVLVLAHAAYSTILCEYLDASSPNKLQLGVRHSADEGVDQPVNSITWSERIRTLTGILDRGALKLKGEEFARAPPQVLTEVLISIVLCFWAALRVPGTFLPILPDSRENRVVSLPANLGFMTFNHRGKLFPPDFEVKFANFQLS